MNIFGFHVPTILEELTLLLLPFTNSFVLLLATYSPKYKDLYNVESASIPHMYSKVVFDTFTIFGILLNTIQVSYSSVLDILSLTLFGLFYLFTSFILPSIFLPYFIDSGTFTNKNALILSILLLIICSIFDFIAKYYIDDIMNYINNMEEHHKKINQYRIIYYFISISLLFIPFLFYIYKNHNFSLYTNNIYRTILLFIIFFSFLIFLEKQIISKYQKIDKKHLNNKKNIYFIKMLSYLPFIILFFILFLFYFVL